MGQRTAGVAKLDRRRERHELEHAIVERPPDLGQQPAPARHDFGAMAERLGIVGYVTPVALLALVHLEDGALGMLW